VISNRDIRTYMSNSFRQDPGSQFSRNAEQSALAYHARLAKPPGSLGRLEEFAAFYAGAHGLMPPPSPTLPTLAIFAADHGVTADGVSAYPSAVTAAVVINVMHGGSAINALTASNQIALRLIDVGISGTLEPAPPDPVIQLERHSLAAGTRNFAREPAMSLEQAGAAIAVGEKVAREAINAGSKLLGVGEIGIGNTACASALIAELTGAPVKDVVGPGAGLDAEGVARKISVVERALTRHRNSRHAENGEPSSADKGLRILAELGGFEVAAMVGFILEAARSRTPVVLDGVVTNAAALVAVELMPTARDFMLASHGSTEPGARVACDKLGLSPLLQLSMRLGEGSGAALGLVLLRSAVDVMLQMSTLDATIERAGLGVKGA